MSSVKGAKKINTYSQRYLIKSFLRQKNRKRSPANKSTRRSPKEQKNLDDAKKEANQKDRRWTKANSTSQNTIRRRHAKNWRKAK
ncbi:hypothetical protein [Dubosiella newyorkensis]|uniref:hypothetical protein n=1 Tax=Dubosiella newyorkensis TaxID=1862672 RepID=UPI003F67658C